MELETAEDDVRAHDAKGTYLSERVSVLLMSWVSSSPLRPQTSSLTRSINNHCEVIGSIRQQL